MLYTEIKIKVFVDESHLTKEQQEQTEKADSDLSLNHPVDQGTDNLEATINNIAAQSFEYLGEGSKAISLVISQ